MKAHDALSSQCSAMLMQRAKALMQNAARCALMSYGYYLPYGAIIRTKSAALVRKDAAFCISAFGALHFLFAH